MIRSGNGQHPEAEDAAFQASTSWTILSMSKAFNSETERNNSLIADNMPVGLY